MIFHVKRKDKVGLCEDYEMIVVGKDAFHAMDIARKESSDFRDKPLEAEQINQFEYGKVVMVLRTEA